MEKIKNFTKIIIEILIVILIIGAWIYSGYKIFNFMKLNGVGACEIGKDCPPTPPAPPTPPCPPGCENGCPTPTPRPTPITTPTPTPVPSENPTPTPTPTPIPTETPSGEPTPTPIASPTSTPTTSGGGDGGGIGGPALCNATKPLAPTLLSVTKNGSKADLSWTNVPEANHYSISYGLSAGNYLYGIIDTGKTTSYTISNLDQSAAYFFSVRAVADCAQSDPSNEIGTGKVLGASIGQVLGLSNTSSGNSIYDILSMIGTLCLILVGKSVLAEKRII